MTFDKMMSILLRLLAVMKVCSASFDVGIQQQIDDVVNAGLRCRHIPGLALAVVKDGQVLINKGYGVKNTGTQDPVTSDTQFQIASLTKAFTAALLANIFDADPNLKLSTPIAHILPAGFRFNNTLRTTYATTEDLLAHRTGIPRSSEMRLADDYSTDTIVQKVHYLPSFGGFRDSFYYNDLMYGLAAHISEVIIGKPWKQQIQETIFGPLGMTRSTFITDVNFDRDNVATPYVVEHGRWVAASIDFIKHWGKNTGSGSIVSTSTDLAKWTAMLLNNGNDTHGARVLRSGVVQQVFQPAGVLSDSSFEEGYKRPVTPVSFSGDTYCLGWRKGHYRDYTLMYHSGSTFGYKAFLTLLPALNVGVVSLMTGEDEDNAFRTPLHEYLMDVALGLTPWINSSTVCTFPDPWKSAYNAQHAAADQQETLITAAAARRRSDKASTRRRARARARQLHAPADIQAYTGHFYHGAYGDLTVRLNTTSQSLELTYGIGLWRLDPIGDRVHFKGHWLKDPPTQNFNFQFRVGGQGQPVIAVEVPDFEVHNPPVFFRTSASSPLVG